MASDPTYPLYPILFFLSFVAVLIPLPWHLQAWNVGTCSFMLWTGVSCFSWFVNSVVWRDDVINRAPVWCDISSRLIIAYSVGIPASSMTITRRLYKISRVQAIMTSKKERRRELAVDLSVCVGLPVLVLILYWFVQGHRFDIFEEIGCFPVVFNTLPAYFLVWMWPLLLGTISMIYCGFTLRAFSNRQKEMKQFLSGNSHITSSRYFRLMTLSMMDTLLTVPLASWVISLNVHSGVRPWKGLADAHWGFSRVEQYPALLWKTDKWTRVTFHCDRALLILCAVVFFAFFGFAEESRKHYSKAYWIVLRRFGYRPKPKTSMFTNSSAGVRTPHLPVMSGQAGLRVLVSTDAKAEKRESFLSSIGDLSSSVSVNTNYEERKDGKSPLETTTDSLPASPDDIELPNLYNVPTSTGALPPVPTRPARPTSLGDVV